MSHARLHFLLLLLALQCLPLTAHAQLCTAEGSCRFKKPNILLVLDYSSSMVGFEEAPAYFPPGQTVTKRWDAQLDAVSWVLRYDNGFFADNARIGLARFAHDPATNTPGTRIGTDISFPPITDGFAVDVPFDGSDDEYLECKSSGVEAEVAVLRSTPPPMIRRDLDVNAIMLTWTRGALRSAHELIAQTRLSHAGEPGEEDREYDVVLMTDGDWTCPDRIGQDCAEDPAPEAALLKADGIPVHVVAFGDATMQPSLNEVALQGGTGAAIDATSPQGIIDALSNVLDQIRASVIVPECTAGLPRMLVIMDGSSSMIEGNTPGQTKWDKARFALTGNLAAPNPGDPGYVEPVFSRQIDVGGRMVAIEDVVHLGMTTFAAANQQKLLVGFGPCMRDNFAWAMDPQTSCEAPGCTDPYAGFPTDWTFKDSDVERDPPFVRRTQSYMPACNQTQGSQSCVGTVPNTFTGQGLTFAQQVIDDYKQSPAPFSADALTRYVNVLVTDGKTSQGSTDVQSALQGMAAAGINTYVIGFGTAAELDQPQLMQYAQWGGTGAAILVDPTQTGSAAALADALEGVVRGLDINSCCVLLDCSENAEPADPGAVCGDGVVNGSEVCDEGALNATYDHCGGLCSGPHLYCGDGRTDDPEQCDDVNAVADDGCDDRCVSDSEDGGVLAPPVRMRAPVLPPGPVSTGGTTTRGERSDDLDAGADGGAQAARDTGCSCRALGGARSSGSARIVLPALLLSRLARRRRRK